MAKWECLVAKATRMHRYQNYPSNGPRAGVCVWNTHHNSRIVQQIIQPLSVQESCDLPRRSIDTFVLAYIELDDVSSSKAWLDHILQCLCFRRISAGGEDHIRFIREQVAATWRLTLRSNAGSSKRYRSKRQSRRSARVSGVKVVRDIRPPLDRF